MAACRSITKKGPRCKNPARESGLCATHDKLESTRESLLKRHAKTIETVGTIAAGTGGLISLIHEIVEFWQSLAFGPQDQDEAFLELREVTGVSVWSQFSGKNYRPFNRDDASMDWPGLLTLFRECKETTVRSQHVDRLEEWISARPEDFQIMLAERLEASDVL